MAGMDPAVKKETGYIAVWVVLLSLLMEAVFLVIRQWDLSVLSGNLGGAALAVTFKGSPSLGTNALYHGSSLPSLLIEIALTFVFVIAILGVTSKIENSSVAGLVIGLSLTLVHIFGIHFTGTSVNPARSFGPALFRAGDAMGCVWVFIVAPLIGGVLAALVYKFLQPEEAKKTEKNK